MKDKITKWYNQKLWNKEMVHDAVMKGVLTSEDYESITGEVYAEYE